ncbi:DUF1826 domain-containing protein [Moritella marina ATCC 15381]|uniref:DUF1826 domain-containing protein n=1 Tax=Moritella marina ATCC 15381 TaxID=1202962 RepID=A0A5J6WQJ3_MORMI|nr:DUF1826 domain-containing protein [Moritella marina]QFI39215.1 DUF1826 domain-containing protein [Moritella marina ATCC 15381]
MSTLSISNNILANTQIQPNQTIPDLHTQGLAEGYNAGVLTDIYQDDINIAVWQRHLDKQLTTAVNQLLEHKPALRLLLVVTPEDCFDVLSEKFEKSDEITRLIDDISLLVDMFCCLFDLKQAGLRLTILDQAMCPRFHVDRIPCRLVTTYTGMGTQWLNNSVIDRTKLGAEYQDTTDEQSGLMQDIADINKLTRGDIALLKGENWNDNAGAGLVHRSPETSQGERRLFLTLDFISD